MASDSLPSITLPKRPILTHDQSNKPDQTVYQWCPTCVSRDTVSLCILFGVSLLYINFRARVNACLAN